MVPAFPRLRLLRPYRWAVSASGVQSAVLDWYASNGRDLAFRRTTDPWAILVSEVMAQQTQAARAAGAWLQFIDHFPTPDALAAASPAVVIRAWRGLGYNRRALALRAAAIAIVTDHDGQVPDELEALVRLPGVGPYTARAVLAIAFSRPVAALDVNIRRVLGRAVLHQSHATGRQRDMQAAADALVPPGRAPEWTHALMDVGAALCRPRLPRCDECPLQRWCRFATEARGATTAGLPAPKADARRTSTSTAFPSTNRWLRGRILDRLRDAPEGSWVAFDDAIGGHDPSRVRAAVAALALEGMIEAVGSRARLDHG
jgi:A/G-specific adenine glycosylase